MDVSTTPVVQYTYSSAGDGSRLASMVYPNGRTIDYNYSGTNLNSALDNAIGRLDSISDGANSGDPGQVLEQYSYLGLSTVIARNHPQTGINLTLIGTSGSIGSGGDQYAGLDQFGRIVNQNWVNSAGTTVDGYTYSFDSNSNVTAENNVLNSAYSQTFTYDPLNRLAGNTLGGVANQSWTLDSQGNWSSYTSNGTTQTQTANAQNQITSISGTSATPTYDASGNTVSMGLTTQPAGSVSTLVYDAWNRLVAVKNSSGQIVAQYTYNAMGYRITETYPQGGTGIPAGEINYIYYDSQWQAIETRTNGTANSNVTSQTVWSAAYINAAILQDTYSGGAIQPNSRIYFLQDANWNTIAIVGFNSPTGTWGVTQRYVYSPYGTITVLNADWSTPPAGTQPLVDNLYQGMTLDPVTGLYYARNRNYDPSLGRWINQDPADYINGANTYQFVMGNPVGNVDPWGLSAQQSPLPLPGEGLQQLADDIESSLYAAGGGSLYGWTSGGAAEFAGIVPRYQNDLAWEEKEVGEAAFAAALKLATMNMSEGAGKLVEAVEKARDAWKRAHPLLAVPKMEQYRFLWQRKYSENWQTLGIKFWYDPVTRTYAGFITGSVGQLDDAGWPSGLGKPRRFIYPFFGVANADGRVLNPAGTAGTPATGTFHYDGK